MMEARRIRRVAIVLALIVLASWTMPAAQEGSSDAMAQVKSAVEKARKILADPGYKSAPQSKRTELLKLLDNNFAFDDMARSSLGSYWKKLNPDQRGRFVELFHQRLERRYVKIIEDYSGAQINFVRESPSGPDRAEVYTNVVNPMLAEPLQMNYLLQRSGGAWKVYDLDIGGISEVDSYRKEYVQIINSQGYDALLKHIANPA
ncbi:MAG TPA: ABC transporter substrate-binding protein [Candidatus Binataceae bacterium]|nr:ABC transporter substrate-binding protein [Candidatus Binataceae bacterium]